MAMRVLALSALILGACASTDTGRYDPEPFKRGGLSARTLAPGQCALFVWRNDAAKTFTLFSSKEESVVHVGKETRFEPKGDPLAPDQIFDAGEREWTLTLGEPEKIETGERYGAGTLRTVTDDGWDLVVPVIGLVSCQPEDTVS